MLNIPLQAIPNQSFSIQIDGNTYDLRIHDCGNVMTVTVSINNVIVVQGFRAVPGSFILPFRYLENGNFLIETLNDEYPDWRRFGLDQFMIFASQAELNAIRFSDIVSVHYAAVA
jgi:hypothetical protein